MLLIAQPKSASTSLMWSLSEIMGIGHKNGHNKTRGDKKCSGFVELQKYHGTTVQRTKSYLRKYIEAPNLLYKEHILPTFDHLKYIDSINKPVIVLLRDPETCIESYKRVFSVMPNLKIDLEKLKKELYDFVNIYSGYALTKYIYKIVYFKDILNDFHKTIKEIIKHYGFKIPDNLEKYKLQKRNYSWSRND